MYPHTLDRMNPECMKYTHISYTFSYWSLLYIRNKYVHLLYVRKVQYMNYRPKHYKRDNDN